MCASSEAARRVLLVVNEPGEFVELSRVADLAAENGYAPGFLFAQPGYINLKRDRAYCMLKGYAVYFLGMPLEKRSASKERIARREAQLENGYLPYSMTADVGSIQNSRWKLILSLIGLAPLMLCQRFGVFRGILGTEDSPKLPRFVYFQSLLFARRAYRHFRPSLVMFGQEFPGSPNSYITQECLKDGIATLIVPFAVGTTKEMVESLYDKPDHQAGNGILNRAAAKLYPRWVNYYKGRELLRQPGQMILILELLGIAPDHPWLPNSSRVTKIAVESEEMLRYYERLRFPAAQLALTGAVYDDVLYDVCRDSQQTREQVASKLRIDPARKWLVCAWPTNQFGSRSEVLEFQDYIQLCHAWAAALADVMRISDFEVVVCPHPVTDSSVLMGVLRDYDLHRRVTRMGTLKLVGCSDIFVACVSSTIRWAIALGVPVINFDCYEYGYTDFDSAPGVRTVTKIADFERQLESWILDADAYAEARAGQLACAKRWGNHDGQSRRRLLSLMDEISVKPPADQTKSRAHAVSASQEAV